MEFTVGPLLALWIKNTSGQVLDAGSFNVLEADTFAGEGVLENNPPGRAPPAFLRWRWSSARKVFRRIESTATRPRTNFQGHHGDDKRGAQTQ